MTASCVCFHLFIAILRLSLVECVRLHPHLTYLSAVPVYRAMNCAVFAPASDMVSTGILAVTMQAFWITWPLSFVREIRRVASATMHCAAFLMDVSVAHLRILPTLIGACTRNEKETIRWQTERFAIEMIVVNGIVLSSAGTGQAILFTKPGFSAVESVDHWTTFFHSLKRFWWSLLHKLCFGWDIWFFIKM